MKTSPQTETKASALIITLLVIFLITAAIGIAMQLTTATVRQTDSSRDFSALRCAAEGALDFGYGIWTKTTNNLYASPPNLRLNQNLGTVPSFNGFSPAPSAEDGPLKLTGTDRYGQPDGNATSASPPPVTRINLDNYPGWSGRNTSYLASVRLMGTFAGGRTVKYGVKREINYTEVPLFQATAFFEDTLELYKTAPMTIGGLVHTNSKAYVSSSVNPASGNSPSLTFSGNLSHVGGYVDGVWTDAGNQQRDAPPEAWNWTGYSPNSSYQPGYSNGGIGQQLNAVARMEPLGADSASLLNTTDANTNNDSMREMIEPPNTAFPDPTPIAQRRLFNKAGILIRITSAPPPNNITITTQNGTNLTTVQRTALTTALSQQTVYDRREGKNVDVTTLNMAQARAQLNGASGFNNILYIDDATSTGYADPKAIRLTNGSILPSEGLTVASQNPVYIQGDYNLGTPSTRVSSSVFADAVTILSNSWNDTLSSSALRFRQAIPTTVNTAIVAGFLPSGWRNEFNVQYGYSGGLNNFPRFLEDWGGEKFTYNGSMIELFTSKIATGEWDTGSIYVPPVRVWDFDSRFTDTPPPGSLDAVSIGRGSLVRF
jgi:hypothetical protein